MKRSEMIEKMKEIWWSMPDDEGDFFKDKLMKKILAMQEKAGMCPVTTNSSVNFNL